MVSVYRRQSSLIAASMDGDPMQQQERERERLRVSLRSDIAELYAMCRLYADFPKLGQPFLDIMPLMRKPALLDRICSAIAAHYRGRIDAVAGLETRGFLFGQLISIRLNVAFVPIRKAGKLPGKVYREEYSKEYGKDAIEIQKDAVAQGDRVVIVDDLLATGGTLAAARQLVETAGATFVEAFVIVEVAGLGGRAAVGADRVFSLLSASE